jgi:hypothetical protein
MPITILAPGMSKNPPIEQEASPVTHRTRLSIICRGPTILLLLTLVSILFRGPIVQAGQISGSQGFSAGTPLAPILLPGGSNLLTATEIQLGTLTTSGSSTGDFTTYVSAGESVGDPALVVATPSAFTFGATAFGTFAGSSLLEDVSGTFPMSTSYYRVIELAGTFTPGTDFPLADRVPTMGDFTVTLTQTFPGGAIGDGGTVFIASVPEPSSVGLLALGTIGVAIGYFRLLRKE